MAPDAGRAFGMMSKGRELNGFYLFLEKPLRCGLQREHGNITRPGFIWASLKAIF